MKNIKYILLLTITLFFGCSDLEEDAPGRLNPDTFFNSPKDIQTAVNGAIGTMATEAYWGRKLTLPLLLKGDLASIGDQGTSKRRRDIDKFEVNSNNGMITAFWPQSFKIIAAANLAIAGAKDVSASDAVKNPIAAQAYFLRAFTYYHLVRLFGAVPYITEPITLDQNASEFVKIPEANVYQKILEDLEFAKSNLPDKQPTRALPSKATAMGYLASVNLTIANLIETGVLTELGTAATYYQAAYNEAKFVIDNEDTFELSLENNFQDLFDATKISGSKEPLFTIDFNGLRSGNFGRDFQAALTGIRGNLKGNIGGGWSVAVPTIEVYNTWNGKDYRKAVSLDTVADFRDPSTRQTISRPFQDFPSFDKRNIVSAYIAKYTRIPGATGEGNGRASSHNYPTMRYAEVLLIAAEALNEITPGAEAESYVNRVLNRARNGDGTVSSTFPEDISGLSQVDFRTRVMEERKWELAFEYKRWYDIKRRQLGTQVFTEGTLENQPNFDSSRDYYFPLPADELARVPGLAPQNPGY